MYIQNQFLLSHPHPQLTSSPTWTTTLGLEPSASRLVLSPSPTLVADFMALIISFSSMSPTDESPAPHEVFKPLTALPQALFQESLPFPIEDRGLADPLDYPTYVS